MNKWVLTKYGIHIHQLVIDMERLGYNGLVISIPDHISELEWVHPFIPPLRAHCEAHNIELIPLMCGIGRLSPYLQRHHPGWQEMIPFNDLYIYEFGHYNWCKPRIEKNAYQAASVIHSDGKLQIAGCMADTDLADWFYDQIAFIQQSTGCKKIFLSLDEIRAGGTCERCKDREPVMLLSTFVERIINKVGENITGWFAWGDMFDPSHNAKKQYHLAGSTEGALDMILESHPDFKVVSWNPKGHDFYACQTNTEYKFMISLNPAKEDVMKYKDLRSHELMGWMLSPWDDDYSKLEEFSKYWRGVG